MMGTMPVVGLISSEKRMQPFTHTLTQRPQPLQYSGTRNGLGFSFRLGMFALLRSLGFNPLENTRNPCFGRWKY